MSFQERIKDFAPGYMLQRYCATLLESVGATLDAYAERVQLGRLASNPLLCQPDVFEYHARDRGITLYSTEPDASKRYRLSRFRQLHATRGTHFGEMENLRPYFLPGTLPKIRIVHQSNDATPRTTWWTINSDGTRERHLRDPSNWDWDGVAAKWARFWVILYTTGTALDGLCATYGDGSTYGESGLVYGGLTASVISDLVAMIEDWSSAHGLLWGFALARDPSSFDPTATAITDPSGWTSLPTGNWGQVVDPTTNLPTRPPTATWIHDLGQG